MEERSKIETFPLRHLKKFRKMLRKKRWDDETRSIFHKADELIKKKQSAYYTKQSTFFQQMMDKFLEKKRNKQ